MDGWMDGWNFSPFYRTSSLLGAAAQKGVFPVHFTWFFYQESGKPSSLEPHPLREGNHHPMRHLVSQAYLSRQPCSDHVSYMEMIRLDKSTEGVLTLHRQTGISPVQGDYDF